VHRHPTKASALTNTAITQLTHFLVFYMIEKKPVDFLRLA
jgi:hypothetical protein